eukprot:CAMPEP_0117486010 /NCGR_PEP_ID=MMETSP0784-20121206/15256_1 /TAXON_ID=39447 /ORGANISM="" /LENGTH=149 /DNA_ID=CAMNT_0005280607 /DNA_START=66 /DNA_END=515 /DNA_ORIENTATION=-
MARSGKVVPCLVLLAAAALLLTSSSEMGFVGARSAPGQMAATRMARFAAEGGGFDAKSLLEPVDTEDPEVLGRSSAFFFAHIGYLLIPILKGLTLGLIFAAGGYFSANGKLVSVVGKENEETAKSVEDVSKAIGRQSAQLWNAVVEKIN